MQRYILDAQGFWQPGNHMVIKELSIVPIDRDLDADPRLYNWLIKPPYPWKRLTQKYREKNFWLMRNYHGLSWESGNFAYSDVRSIIQEQISDASMIYVDGPERKQWLDEILENKKIVMDIRDIGYVEPARAVVTVCANHNALRKVVCALHHAKLMRNYALHHVEAMEWEDVSEWI